jgi:hypothetical protein
MLTVLETLGPTERAVFVLREVFEMPYGEIAEAVGKPVAAVQAVGGGPAAPRVAGTDDHGVAQCGQPAGGLVAEALVGPGNEGDGSHESSIGSATTGNQGCLDRRKARTTVADLRRASARYPGDARLAGLITRTLNGNPRFAQLWPDGAVGAHAEDRKTIRHPDIGEITVDCDVLGDSDTDLKIVVYTTVPGSEDETKLDLARVAGARPAR